MRKLIRDFILGNAFMRFGEITELKWKMVKTKVETDPKGENRTFVLSNFPRRFVRIKR